MQGKGWTQRLRHGDRQRWQMRAQLMLIPPALLQFTTKNKQKELSLLQGVVWQ